MPTSYLHQINEITDLMVIAQPQRILDVGVGFGKYGVLAREYLDLRDGREAYQDWQRRVDGIEIFPEYLTPLHDFIYDHIYIGDAATIVETLETTYDLILVIDVIEHFSLEAGMAFLKNCQKVARNILVSTPKSFIAQQGAFGNPYETHHAHWRKQDFAAFTDKIFIPNIYSHICWIGEDSRLIQQQYFTPRRRFQRSFPYLWYPYEALKKKLLGLR